MFDDMRQLASTFDSTRTSKYDSIFSVEERALLNEFVSYLVVECSFQKSSASSYRSNFSRATVKSRNNESLSSDERSAVKKFDEFMNAR